MEQSRLIKFLIYLIVISVALNLSASVLGASNVHLGNTFFRGSIAAVLSGLILTGWYYQIPKIVKNSKFKVEKENQWALVFLISNAIMLYILKDLAFITGVGISNIFFVLIVASFVTFTERITDKVWQSLETK